MRRKRDILSGEESTIDTWDGDGTDLKVEEKKRKKMRENETEDTK